MDTTFAIAVAKIAALPTEEQRAIALELLEKAGEAELPVMV